MSAAAVRRIAVNITKLPELLKRPQYYDIANGRRTSR
jgi:hypothetical protein